MAELLLPLVRSTWKFMRFMERHMPDPPESRPPPPFQTDWGRMEASLRKIYSYRSEALHGGTPFPAPMCMPPDPIDGTQSETSFGTAAAQSDAIWVKEDLPDAAAMFEYVARGTLLDWWSGSGGVG